MQLSDHVNTLGRYLKQRFGEKVHKISINAGFTCPNRDGTKGHGGCTFCNNASFSPNVRKPPSIAEQIASGKHVIRKRTGAKRYLAYFQAYTNTYSDVSRLKDLYQQALNTEAIVGLSVGTRPDCVPDPVLDLLSSYRDSGYEVWLELGLQSAFDQTLVRVNRGHTFGDYQDAVKRAHQRQLLVCTHLIVGLPGESRDHYFISLQEVLEGGVAGLKIHPLHVVKGSFLAKEWREGQYAPLSKEEYVDVAREIVQKTPKEVVFHRLMATAQNDLLLTPLWCGKKWRVLNAIAMELAKTGPQGCLY